nr:uncharacterized protein LOC109146841 [Ipomoea trifida]
MAPASGRRSSGTSSRRAAEEDEHVVIRGENGGNLISSSRVYTGEVCVEAVPADGCSSPEHHGDPPDAFDPEGDVVMEIEDPCDSSLGGNDFRQHLLFTSLESPQTMPPFSFVRRPGIHTTIGILFVFRQPG